MTIVMAPSIWRRSLVWIQRSLFAAAILMLGYSGFVMADTWMFQREASRELSHPRDEQSDVAETAPPDVAIKGLIGRIEIARLGLSVVVMEGTSAHTLRRAAGHIEGTALPGEPGNVGISGHRDTLFRPLKDVHRDDIIMVSTPGVSTVIGLSP